VAVKTVLRRSIEKKLNYVTVDEGEIGGTVAKYPRQKLVLTSPVEFPMHGKFKKQSPSERNVRSFNTARFWRKGF